MQPTPPAGPATIISVAPRAAKIDPVEKEIFIHANRLCMKSSGSGGEGLEPFSTKGPELWRLTVDKRVFSIANATFQATHKEDEYIGRWEVIDGAPVVFYRSEIRDQDPAVKKTPRGLRIPAISQQQEQTANIASTTSSFVPDKNVAELLNFFKEKKCGINWSKVKILLASSAHTSEPVSNRKRGMKVHPVASRSISAIGVANDAPPQSPGGSHTPIPLSASIGVVFNYLPPPTVSAPNSPSPAPTTTSTPSKPPVHVPTTDGKFVQMPPPKASDLPPANPNCCVIL